MTTTASHGSAAGSRAPSSQASAAPGASARAPAIESLVCFTIANRSYALDVALVREVVAVSAVFPVPKMPAPVLGVFSLRGATVALIETSLLLGLGAGGEPAAALVVVRNHQTVCGLTIDRVIGVSRFIERNFIPADAGHEPPEVIGFMPDERSGLVTVLDAGVVLSALNRLRFH
jgi:purine-binding chemotaxis protein CheW